ncbi:MAG: DNA-binding response regulator, partial [Betaproteobacteria bacterium]|nr:DNA-binding response regulator [Betaproteobacteria bacterium]
MLLIEDDPTIAHELALRWQQRGWQLQAVATLAAARGAIALPGWFDLVLLDRGLPDGDGLDLLAELRRGDTHTPVLVLTARDQVADRVQGLLTQTGPALITEPVQVTETESAPRCFGGAAQ